MTPTQKHLARGALGLPNPSNRSARNLSAVHPDVPRFADWQAMADADLARSEKCGLQGYLFTLTRAGAEAALEPHERLDPADFPPIGSE